MKSRHLATALDASMLGDEKHPRMLGMQVQTLSKTKVQLQL